MSKTEYRNEQGQLHRDGGLPAREYTNGTNEWYVNGQLHRDGGLPAQEYANGDKFWYVNDKLHREGGLPAVECADGDKQWWVNGVQIPQPPPVWTTSQKQPDWTGQTCVITLETIGSDSEVCKCDVCLALMLFGVLEEWLNTDDTCPHCRSPWTNYTNYTN